MAQVSLPVTRPTGRALLVSSPASRSDVRDTVERLGYGCSESDDPYAAMVELCRRPLVYRAVILSLAGLYREELAIIRAVKRRYPHIEIWLAHTDGRQAALADAMRLGADGLLDDDGLHRVALHGAPNDEAPAETVSPAVGDAPEDGEDSSVEPILSAEELKALLHEQPAAPPAREEQR